MNPEACGGCGGPIEPFPAIWIAAGREHCQERCAQGVDNAVGSNTDTRVPELYRHESEARRIRWAHEARNEQEAS